MEKKINTGKRIILDKQDFSYKTLSLYTIAFLMSFCSITYELLIATELSFIKSERIFVYPASLSLFIFAMGLGSMVWSRKKDSLFGISYEYWLLIVEIIIAFLGFLSIYIIDSSFAPLEGAYNRPIIIGLLLSILIGFFSGQEIPLLFRYCSANKLAGYKLRNIIFFDYLASLVASLFFLLLFFPAIGILRTSFVAGFINLFILLILILALKTGIRKVRIAGIVLFSVLIIIGSIIIYNSESIEVKLIRKAVAYPEEKMVAKFYTKYQRVALFVSRKDGYYITDDYDVFKHPEKYSFNLYLNWALQFDVTGDAFPGPYEIDFVHPFVKSMSNIKDVLILGGGDGLTAEQLLTYAQIKSIDLVDIDQEWIDFTRNNPYMRIVNSSSFRDPRMNIHIQDAFKWIITTKKRYDAVFIDFPEDTTISTIRTVSLQFFNDLKRILNPNGIIVVNDDDPACFSARDSAYNTAIEVGMYPIYGTHSTKSGLASIQLCLFKEEQDRNDYMNYFHNEYLEDPDNKEHLSKYGYMRYIAQDSIDPKAKRISFYDPVVLRWDWKDLKNFFREK